MFYYCDLLYTLLTNLYTYSQLQRRHSGGRLPTKWPYPWSRSRSRGAERGRSISSKKGKARTTGDGGLFDSGVRQLCQDIWRTHHNYDNTRIPLGRGIPPKPAVSPVLDRDIPPLFERFLRGWGIRYEDGRRLYSVNI